jgi:hypothetical protein
MQHRIALRCSLLTTITEKRSPTKTRCLSRTATLPCARARLASGGRTRRRARKRLGSEGAFQLTRQVAKAGFISTPSKMSPDGTQCPLCLYEVVDWETADDPW